MRLMINGRFLTQPVTGVQKVAIEFLGALDRMLARGDMPGLEVTLLAPARAALVTAPRWPRISLRRGGRLSGHAWEQVELPGLAGRAPLLCLGNLAPVARLLAGRGETFTMVHDLSYRHFPAAYRPAFRALYRAVIPQVLRRSAAVFTVSESERAAILGAYPGLIAPDRLLAVQNGGADGDAAPPGPSPARDERAPVCLYVGSLTRRKNAPGLIAACVALAAQTDLRFVFVGGRGAGFEAVPDDVPGHLAPRFRFLGQVDDAAAVAAEYRAARLFLFPSFYEASPLPPVEAMLHGCPVVAADIPSLRERCGAAAEYCDPADPGSIVAAARRVLGDAGRWRALQDAGRAQAARYSWERQARAILARIGAAA